MNYILLIIAFILLFGYEGANVITLLDFAGYLMLFIALGKLRLNKFFRTGMYFALGNSILWLIMFYIGFLFGENTPESLSLLLAHIYVWLSYAIFAGSIICTMLGIHSEAKVFKLRWLEMLSITILVAYLIESLILNAAVYVLQWEVLVPMQFVVMIINAILIATTIFARFNLQRKDI